MDAAYPVVANIASAIPKYIPHNKKDIWRICMPLAAVVTAMTAMYILNRHYKWLKDEYSQPTFDAKTDEVVQQTLGQNSKDKDGNKVSLADAYAGADTINPMRPKWLNDKIAALVASNPRRLGKKLPLVIDFSAHTRANLYGMLTPKQLVQWELCNGYDGVVVTDMRTCDAVGTVQAEAAKIAPGFHVLSGFRVTGESPKTKGYRMCVCGANHVPFVAKLAGALPYEIESRALLKRVTNWAVQNNCLVYSDAELGCSCMYDVQKYKGPSRYTVVFVNRAAMKKNSTQEIVRAVCKGSWLNIENQGGGDNGNAKNAAASHDDDSAESDNNNDNNSFVPVGSLKPNLKRGHAEKRWFKAFLPK